MTEIQKLKEHVCYGCRRGEKDDCIFISDRHRDKVNTDKCPCKKCIVKMICSVFCEVRREFYFNSYTIFINTIYG